MLDSRENLEDSTSPVITNQARKLKQYLGKKEIQLVLVVVCHGTSLYIKVEGSNEILERESESSLLSLFLLPNDLLRVVRLTNRQCKRGLQSMLLNFDITLGLSMEGKL